MQRTSLHLGESDAVIVVDLEGVVQFVNLAAQTLFGRAPEDYSGELVGFSLEPGKPLEIQIVRSGENRTVEMRVIHFEWGCTPASLAIFREPPQRHTQTIDAMARLASGTAHDFMGLLTVISGGVNTLLRREVYIPRHRAMLDDMRTAIERATTLSKQLMQISRNSLLPTEILDLNVVVGDSLGVLGRLVGEDILLTTTFGESISRIEANRSQVEQIIMNLVLNARDAVSPGGKISVEVRRVFVSKPLPSAADPIPRGEYTLLVVSDDGVGIDERTRSRIFEPFFTTKGVDQGAGMGLTATHDMVCLNGGFIVVESEVGRGATFQVYFPRVATLFPSKN